MELGEADTLLCGLALSHPDMHQHTPLSLSLSLSPELVTNAPFLSLSLSLLLSFLCSLIDLLRCARIRFRHETESQTAANRRKKARNLPMVLFSHSLLNQPADTITSLLRHKGLSLRPEMEHIMPTLPSFRRTPRVDTRPPTTATEVIRVRGIRPLAMRISNLTCLQQPAPSA